MRIIFLLVLVLKTSFFFANHFDVTVVGTSPICLIEALYQHHSGKTVLILEGSTDCGGAWKSISVCGLPHAELGCHLIGKNQEVAKFLEDYIGCQVVSMDKPNLTYKEFDGPNGFYLAGGCHELVSKLLKLIEKTNIVLSTNHFMNSIDVNQNKNAIIVKTNQTEFITKKLIATPYTYVKINDLPEFPVKQQTFGKTKHYHLYVLINDNATSKFSYRSGIGYGTLRIMNMTPFIGLENSGLQLIVFQVSSPTNFSSANDYINTLKTLNLISKDAYIVKTDTYTYEQFQFNHNHLNQIKSLNDRMEILHTYKIIDMQKHLKRWKTVLPILKETKMHALKV